MLQNCLYNTRAVFSILLRRSLQFICHGAVKIEEEEENEKKG